MIIDFVRSGGVAGLRLTVVVDTDALPAEDAYRIQQLVEASGFYDMEEGAGQPPTADRFQYRLLIESPVWGSRTATLAESDIPDELRPLVEFLTRFALNRGLDVSAAEPPADPAV